MSKKITVAGIGGVGGYLAGMLADTYDEVSFIARGERKKSLEEEWACYIGKGIVVDSLIYILSYTKEDFSVVQKENFADIKIGISNANEREKKGSRRRIPVAERGEGGLRCCGRY